MQLIGLTGGIGSGKSTIASAIEALGYPVYNTDREAKRIIVHNPAVRSQIETLFGSDVFDGDILSPSYRKSKNLGHIQCPLQLNFSQSLHFHSPGQG